MKKGTSDVVLALILLLAGGYAFFEAADFPNIASHFPRRVALLLAILSCVLLAMGVYSMKNDSTRCATGSYRNVTLLSGAIAVYIVFLDKAGYLLSTIGLMLAVMYALGYRNGKKAFLAAVCSVLAAFVVFRFLLGVPLPLGVFAEG